MSEVPDDLQPQSAPQSDLDGKRTLLALFDRLSIRQRFAKIRFGLKQPKDSGDYKWAIVECQRLSAPAAAVVVPLLAMLMLVAFGAIAPESRKYEVQMLEAEKAPELDKLKEIIEPPPEMPEVDVDVNPDAPVTDAPPTPPTDFSPQVAEFDSVAITRSPVVLRGVYGARNPGNRGSALASGGGGSGTEGAVLRALRWLKTKQESDGSWPQTRPAMTSLAILAYLAHGETPASEEFGGTVERAMRYLVDSMNDSGRFKGRDGHDYTQPIGAYALAEAYGMTKVPDLKYAAEKAIEVVIKGQNAVGGFNYNLVGPTDQRNDTTYTSWCVQALKAAKMAGLENPGLDACMRKAVDGVRKNYAERDGYGGFGYTGPGGTGGTGLSGAGVLCLQFLGDTKSKEYLGGITGLGNATFDWAAPFGRSPIYYWYYITQAMFQHGGDTWSGWNRQFSPTLVKNQQIILKDQSGYVDHKGVPHAIGWWDSPAASEHHDGGQGGQIMDTILSTLMLEVYYRYLPTFKTTDAEKVDLNKTDKQNLNISIKM